MNGSFTIEPQPVVSLAVQGDDARFPVGRVFCIGRNYAADAVEMEHDPDREEPFFFLKPATAVTPSGRFAYPAGRGEVHHEVELIVALSQGGKDIPTETALEHVFGYGIDMTLRDVQAEAKRLGRPWDVSKGFDGSGPCGQLRAVSKIGHPDRGSIRLSVNGETRQSGNLDQMIWKVPEIISTLSQIFRLVPGDLIMTGTPSGVGAIFPGDAISASVDGVGDLSISVEA